MAETSSKNEVPPLNLLLMLKEESGVDLFSLPLQELCDRLRTGFILRDKKKNTETQFFWMDQKSNLNCFLLLPNSLRISTDSGQVPQVITEKETWLTGKEIILPQMKYENVRHLKVGGKFGTMGLSARGSEYEVVLMLKLKKKPEVQIVDWASNKKMSLPDGSQTQQPWRFMGGIIPEEWHSLQIGTFRMTPNNVGELSFDIQVFFWGSRFDILIKGVAIKPTSPYC